jgi:predicted anti-sigma-YlaC factor YlaD
MMKAPYFVETLSRGGEVLHRQQLASLPIRLGRAYDNDVILDDAHTAAQHAVIDSYDDAHLMLRDLGGRNGTVHQGKRHSTVIMGGDTVVRLGQTHLRVRGASYPVPPELADTTVYAWEGATPALVGLALVAIVSIMTSWLGDVQKFDAIPYLMVVASALGLSLLWGAIWAVAGRLFGGIARYGRHLFILGCGVAALQITNGVTTVAAYSFSLEWLTRYDIHLAVIMVWIMIFFHLRTLRPYHARGFAKVCTVLALVSSGLVLMNHLQSTGRLSSQLYMSALLPPALKQSRDHTPAEFFNQAATLKAAVDSERGKATDDGLDGDDSEDDDS